MINEQISEFKTYLINDEKSKATIEKYTRDVLTFSRWLAKRELCKSTVLEYKERIIELYAPRSVNSVISSLNAFFEFIARVGSIFVTKTGNPLDRISIWKLVKSLCESAGVNKDKVFPHNLRHLFARTFYNLEKDIVRLADILGHSSVNTTRIYTMESGDICRKQIQKLGLLKC